MALWRSDNPTGCCIEIKDKSGAVICDWDLRGRSQPPSKAIMPVILAAPELLEIAEKMVEKANHQYFEGRFVVIPTETLVDLRQIVEQLKRDE